VPFEQCAQTEAHDFVIVHDDDSECHRTLLCARLH
jgi:hypothetical protein